MKEQSFSRHFQLLVCFVLVCSMAVLQCAAAFGAQSEDFPTGSQLPQLSLPAPDSPQAQKYLGIKEMTSFKFSDVGAKCVLIEFMSAMCPHCLVNAPIMNKLYKVVQGDRDLSKKVKIIGIAVGNDDSQLDAYMKKFKVPFPVFSDEGYSVTGPIGGVATPTMVLATKDGKILSSHKGVIEDFDGYLKELKEIVNAQ